MTAIRPAGLDAFLRKPDPAIAAVLIYGEEPDPVRELAARLVKKVAGALDDPFTVATLQEQDIASDPARLADEVQSISMFGGAKAVWVKGAGEAFGKAVAPLLAGGARGNMVVAEAQSLSKASQLRALFEKSPHALAVPLYAAEPGEAAGLAEQLLAQDGLKIGPDALARFVELSGTARALVRREAEKLALYCLGAGRVSIEDVEAVCGNDAGATPDALADSVFGGDVEEADRLFHDLARGGQDAGQLLAAAHRHVLRLADFRVAIERGAQPDQVVKQARPPVFFRRQPKVLAQLRAWSLSDLATAGSTLSANVLAARRNAGLSQAIAGRCLLSLARKGLSLRLER